MDILSGFVRHMDLMSRMFRLTTANSGELQDIRLENDLKQAMLRCVSCRETGACADWLEKAQEGDAPPAFCRNAAYIERLRETA